VKRKQWLLLAALIVAMFALSACGVSREGTVDVATTAPDGLWQTFVVWPLAKTLIWLNGILVGWGIPYSWGFTIILFTVIVKVVTFPLTYTQMRGMQAQKELQPKIKELQKKHGKDRDKLSKAQMELYQEAGVNPLSGCLPLIVQMPILFGLYSALVILGPYLVDTSFFWIPDLGFPRYTQGLGWIPTLFQAGEYSTLIAYLILPVLLVVSQFIMQKYMTPPSPGSEQSAMTQQLPMLMTFMFGFFTLQVPAALSLYWVTSNFLQMGQQWVILSDRINLTGSGKTAGKLESASPEDDEIPVVIDGEVTESSSSSPEEEPKPSNRSKRRKSKKKR
jgi:YidC/Oxa1 family membrane protein insertase